MIRYCVRCNKPFFPSNSIQKTCSETCSKELKKSRRGKRRKLFHKKIREYYRTKTNPYFYLQFFRRMLTVLDKEIEKNKQRNRRRIRRRIRRKMRNLIRKNYPRNKAWVYKQLGNKCQRCGNDNPIVFEIHHPNPAKKPKGWGRGKQKRVLFARWFKQGFIPKEEKQNMMLLCANCHRIIESQK